MDVQEVPAYKKKSKTASTSRSEKRVNHKHKYEKVILEGFLFGWSWGRRCRICGRTERKSFSSYRDFVKPEYAASRCIEEEYFYTIDELRDVFPNVQIYVRVDPNDLDNYKLAE